MENKESLGWLIRDNLNTIRGPYSRLEVLQLIKNSQLRPKTEVAQANAYWFSLEEKQELYNFFPELNPASKDKGKEQETRMTATLVTQAAVEKDPAINTKTVELAELPDPPSSSEESKDSQAQWLSSELKEEFGFSDITADSLQDSIPTEATQKDFSRMATVKADTLPSERKGSNAERPKPINDLFKGGGGDRLQSAPQNLVSVPVAQHDGQLNILDHEAEVQNKHNRNTLVIRIVVGIGVVLLIGGMIIGAQLNEAGKENQRQLEAAKVKPKQGVALDPKKEMQKSFLLFDFEESKNALKNLESALKDDAIIPLSQALFKKEFLFDIDGAFNTLTTTLSSIEKVELRAEVENLIALYGYDKDAASAITTLKKVASSFPEEPIYQYNLAVALVRSKKYAEAINILNAMSINSQDAMGLLEPIQSLLGWSREIASNFNGGAAAESSFQKALGADIYSAKARLGLAIHKLREGGLKESEGDFRMFLEIVPDLDGHDRVYNFRKMSDFFLYNFVRDQIRELNVPGGPVGVRPSPLVMAVDAVLSCLQNRTGEAGKILEDAIKQAPGDIHILKAVAFHRWKENRYDDIIELLKDTRRGQSSFAVNYLIGKSYLRLNKKKEAEKHFLMLTNVAPTRSESWSSLGELRLDDGKDADAKRLFTSALERDPQDLVALRGLAALGVLKVLSDEYKNNLPF